MTALEELSTSLRLSLAERRELEWTRNRHRHPSMRERAAALLKIADGASPRSVALSGLLRRRKPDTVYSWLHQYQRERTLPPRPATRGVHSPPHPTREDHP